MKKLALITSLFVLLLPCFAFAQTETDFFGLDTTQGKKKLVLPLIYFEDGSAIVNPLAKEEISYIAFMLHIHPEASLRLKTQALYKRFERQPRRLNKKRMRRIRKILKKEYQVPGKRIITIHHQPWVYRSGRDPIPSRLMQRRVVCDVIWE